MFDQQDIATRRDEWVSIVNSGDVDAYVGLLSEDVLWLPPGQPPLRGRDEFLVWIEPFFERFRYTFDIRRAVVRIAGDWAIDRGTFDTFLTPIERPSGRHTGRYLVFWHREQDGTWYLERHIDETD